MRKKIYFLLGSYPIVSETFLYNQILEVAKENSCEVKIIILRRTNEEVHDAYKLLSSRILLFSVPSKAQIYTKIKITLTSLFSLLLFNPKILFKCLNFIKYGRKCASYIVLANLFKNIQPDILHSHFGPNGNIAADLKEIGAIQCKILTSFHGMDITVYPKQFGPEYYARLFKIGEWFTGNSRFIINKMLDAGCPEGKIVKIPECLNIDQFTYRGTSPYKDPFKILTVGRFVEKKGYQYSLEAIASFSTYNIPFEYHIIGEGPLKTEMIELAKKLNIEQYVIFHGAMKQELVKTFYQQTHVFMLPSVTAANGDTEGQGLVLQEAQAVGVPIVATFHNGFPDSIVEGVTGFLVPERDSQRLCEKLVLLSRDEVLRDEMGRSGRLFVENNFDSKIIIKPLISLYDEMVLCHTN
jgi:colanic acid/amylovoran biosynthesis glycosyltransferase